MSKYKNDGATRLLIASQNGHLDVVRELLPRGGHIEAEALSVVSGAEVSRKESSRRAHVSSMQQVGAASSLKVRESEDAS